VNGAGMSHLADLSPAGLTAFVMKVVVTKEQLLVVLERANWNHARAAKILGVARATVWRWITKDPELLRIVEKRSTGTYRKS